MQEKTFAEWTALYEQKTGKPFKRQESMRLFFYPERGFAELGVDTENKLVVAYQLCGDGWFWRRVMETLALSLGYTHCGTVCIRRIKPYIRFWGYRIDKTGYTDDGIPRYYCTDNHGRKLTCSPAWRDDETGEYAYWMTWEVNDYAT